MGAVPALRLHDGHEFITDNGNRIVDCAFPPITDPVELGEALKRIPGVVEHGLFAKQLVSKVIIGYENGEVLYKKPPPAGRG
jgi:ribose 5-phosphate isomerase A